MQRFSHYNKDFNNNYLELFPPPRRNQTWAMVKLSKLFTPWLEKGAINSISCFSMSELQIALTYGDTRYYMKG